MTTKHLDKTHDLSSNGSVVWINDRKTEACVARCSPSLLEIMPPVGGDPSKYRAEEVKPGVERWPRFRELVKEHLSLDLPEESPL